MKTSIISRHTQAEERGIRAAEFAWDLAVQLAALREHRGLTQAQLAKLVGTHQQAISRLENPVYGRQSLAALREVVTALNAYVDVILVPEEKADAYCGQRYLPVLDDAPRSGQAVEKVADARCEPAAG